MSPINFYLHLSSPGSPTGAGRGSGSLLGQTTRETAELNHGQMPLKGPEDRVSSNIASALTAALVWSLIYSMSMSAPTTH